MEVIHNLLASTERAFQQAFRRILFTVKQQVIQIFISLNYRI